VIAGSLSFHGRFAFIVCAAGCAAIPVARDSVLLVVASGFTPVLPLAHVRTVTHKATSNIMSMGMNRILESGRASSESADRHDRRR
jgi:hypothetical protein